MRFLSILVTLLLAVVFAAPSGGASAQSAGAATPAEASEARQLLQQASDRLADTQTMRFELTVDGDTYIDDAGAIRLVAARGSLERPNKVDVEFQVELLGSQTVSIRMITIGDESWTTDLLSGQWGPSPEEFGYDPTVLFDNQDGLGPVAGRLQEPTIESKEEVGNREAWKISGTVDESVIAPMTAGTMKGDDIRVTLWLDTETSDILQLQVAEPDDIDKEHPATWTMTLTDHNREVTIERPDVNG
jgi:hypothetical protein